MKTLARPFEIKAIADDGTFEGYGSVFDVMDSYRDVVMPGAFAKTIDAHAGKNSMPALLWQHSPGEPIGIWESMAEDKHGLKMNGRLALDVQRGREAYSLLKMGAVKGLSIGYSVPKDGSKFDKEAGINYLSEVDLWETSLVTFPANMEAQITEVRSALEDGIYPGVRAFTDWLMRDAGFSKEDAIYITRHGYKPLLMRDAERIQPLHELMDKLRKL